MSNYSMKRKSKVNMVSELSRIGWKIYGYKENQSDPMTDYYSPAYWDGIATKNGFTLVVDCWSESEGRDITRYNPNYIEMSKSDLSKIASLKNMTVENGATNGEAENAKNLIVKLNAKYNEQGVAKYEVIGHQPRHMANPKSCTWHLEKDGSLFDKGKGLTSFYYLPDEYMFDMAKMEYKESYKYYTKYQYNEKTGYNEDIRVLRTLDEEEEKAIKSFKAFILRIERVINSMNGCGDGTAETEKAGQEQKENEKMEKIIVEKVKKVIKLEDVKREAALRVGDIVHTNNGYCKVTEVMENLYRGVKLGSASRGYQESKVLSGWMSLSRKSWDGALNRGNLKVYKLIEIEEIEKIEKWVRVKATKKANKPAEKKVVNKEIKTAEVNQEKTVSPEENLKVEIKFNEEKNGIELYFNGRPSAELRNNLKSNKFRCFKNKEGVWVWYCKDTEDQRDFIKSLGFLNEGERVAEVKEQEEKNYSEVDIQDIENYTIDKSLSSRENTQSMFRSKDKNHEQEIQSILQNWNDRLIEALENNNNNYTEYKAKTSLQSFKKKYYAIYIKMLTHKANNPSWAYTGRGGMNVDRYNKKQGQYEKMIGESVEISNNFDSFIEKTTWSIKKENKVKDKAIFEDAKKNISIHNVKFIKTKGDNLNGLKLDFTVIQYHYNGYSILSNYWGKFRVYYNGKEVTSCNSLKDAKTTVLALEKKIA